MMKKLIAAALLAAMLALPALCLGEEAESALPQTGSVQFETLFQYQKEIVPVTGTNYLIMSEKKTEKKAVFDTAGSQLSPYVFKNLSYASYGCFTGYNDAEELNSRALLLWNGTVLTEAAYASFDVYSGNWAAGYVYSPATEEAYDVKRGKELFHVDRIDVFYMDGQSAALVASLTKEEFSAAAAHGDYLAVQDGEGNIVLHDRTFKALDLGMQKTSSSVYGVVDYALVNLATGETVADGFTEVKEQTTSKGFWLIAGRFEFTGKKIYGILDAAGNEILPVQYAIGAVTDEYAVITDGDLKGLYSLTESRMIVPVEYSGIVTGKTAVDNYVYNGYVAVEMGDTWGYYDVKAGKLSCQITKSRKEMTMIGCSSFWKVEDGVYTLTAADGVETEVHVDEISGKTRGNGYLLVAVKDKMYGLIDWHGNEILPFIHNKAITITDDSQAILRTGTGMQMDRIVIGQ